MGVLSISWKKFCINTICPTNCVSMSFIKTANRFCYDENYLRDTESSNLKYPYKQIRKHEHYPEGRVRIGADGKQRGKQGLVSNGIIGHATCSGGSGQFTEDAGAYAWEKNLSPILPIEEYDLGEHSYMLKEVCDELGYSYRKIMNRLNKYEMEDLND